MRSLELATYECEQKEANQFFKKCSGNIRKVCVLFLVLPDVCRKRDAERSRTVGKDVIDKFLRSFHCPYWYEGWDEIIPVIDDASFSFPIESPFLMVEVVEVICINCYRL